MAIAKRYEEYVKTAKQAAYGLPPEEAVQKVMSLSKSGIPEIVLLGVVGEIMNSNKPPAQAPQGTVKDKILAAAAPQQQGGPQGMPQGMPQPGVPPQEMPQQAMPPMPEGLPPMPPQGMAEGGSVNDYGVASLPGERGDEYAIDQGLGSLSANIDYAGGGIVSFAEGGRSNAQEILRKGLRDPYQDEGYSRQVQEALYGATGGDRGRLAREDGSLRADLRRAGDDEEALKDAMNMLTRDEIFAARGLSSPGHISRDMMQDPTSFNLFTEPLTGDMGAEEFRSVAGGPSRWYRNPSLPKGPVKPAALEEPNPDDTYMSEIDAMFKQGPAGLGRVSIPKVTEEEYPDAMQIERTPEFNLEQRLAQEAEANKAYGVNPNLLAEQQTALNEDLTALQGRAKQATWASLGKRAAGAWDVQPGQGAPTLMGGLANLFGGMSEDLEASNATVRAEKREIQRYQRELARADNLERKGQAAKAQEARLQNEITHRNEENRQRELNQAEKMGLFTLNQSREDNERAANLEIDIANMKEQGAFNRAALTARSGAMGNIYELQKMMLDLEKQGLVKPGEGRQIFEQVYSDPQLRPAAEAALEAQGKLDDATESQISEAMDTIAKQRVAGIIDSLMSNQETQIGGIRERIFGNSGFQYRPDSGGL